MIFRILLCLMVIGKVSGQSWMQQSTTYEYPVYQLPVELPNGDLFFVENNIFVLPDSLQMGIMDKDGIIKTSRDYNYEAERVSYKARLHLPEQELIALFFSLYDTEPDSANHLLITLVDYQLNVLEEFTWYNGSDLDLYDVQHITPLLMSNGDMLMSMVCNLNNFDFPNVIKYIKCNTDIGPYGYYEINSGDSVLYTGNLVEAWNGEAYISSHRYNVIVDTSLSGHAINNLYSGIFPVPLGLGTTHMKRWSEGQYIANSNTTISYRVVIFNEEYEVLVDNELYDNETGVAETLNQTTNLDYIHKDKVYLCGKRVSPIQPSSFLWVHQVNEALNTNWKLYIGLDDNRWWEPGGIVATQDGGVLVVGINGGDGDRRAFMIKIDAEGNPPTSTLDHHINMYIVKTYPNPSSGILHIDIQSDKNTVYSMQMYNQSGALVYESDALQIGNNSFDLTHLANGIYYYQLMSKDKVLLNEQWIKQD